MAPPAALTREPPTGRRVTRLRLTLRLPPDIERWLDALAKKTGRSKSVFVRDAILRQLEHIEDDYLARRQQKRLLELVGTLEWDGSCEIKAERGRK